MSKKRTGLLIALGAMIGAAAAGIAYYLQYKSFNDELDKDFHDYEEEDGPGGERKDEPVPCQEAAGRNYITLDSAKCRTEEEPLPTSDTEEAAQSACPAAGEKAVLHTAHVVEEEAACPADAEKAKAFPSADDAKEAVRPVTDMTVEEDTEGGTI